MASPIHPLWIDPEKIRVAPLTIADNKFARELLECYNINRTMNRKRNLPESDSSEDAREPPETREPMISPLQVFTSCYKTVKTVFNWLGITNTPDEAVYTYTEHLGSKRRRVVTLDPALATPPTPLATKYSVPGAWPVTSEAPSVLTPENAQAAWDAASEEERKLMLQGSADQPYWRQNGLPPHFPYRDLNQMLEYKYLRSEDSDLWNLTNIANYKPKIEFNTTRVSRPEQDKELPAVLHPIYLNTPDKKARFNAYPWLCMSKTYERVLDANSYRPFTKVRKFAHQVPSTTPKTVEEITDRIKHYKSIKERRDYDRTHPGVLRYRQQSAIGLHWSRPAGYPGIQKTSPYRYRHGQNRPVTSVLKTSHAKYRAFEPYLKGETPKRNEPSTPAAKTAQHGDEAGDTSMMDVDVDIEIRRGVHWPATSRITGKLHQPTKLFYKEEPITSMPPDKFRQYRNPTPPEDDSILVDETPRRYYGHEQDLEPTYDSNDQELETMAQHWEARIAEKAKNFQQKLERWNDPDADQESTPSKISQKKWTNTHERSQARDQKKFNELLAKIAERHELERQVRAVAAARKAEEERRLQQALAKRAEELQKAKDEEARAFQKTISLIKPLSDEWSAKVDAAMATRNTSQIVIPKHNISRHDLGSILPQRGVDHSQWLNDQIVNSSLQQMVDHAHALENHDTKTKPALYWAANSNWLKTVLKSQKTVDGESYSDGITRWLGKRNVKLQGKNFLQAKVILLPICSESHWTLVVIKPRERIMEYLDSLSGGHIDQSKIRAAISFVKNELGKDFDQDEWDFRFGQSPQQDNGVDCGAFVIMNAMATIRGFTPSVWVRSSEMLTARRMIVAQLMNGGYTGEFAWMEKTLEMPASFKEKLGGRSL
ncbi:cysteine proteinase [Venturia nashicola]|uniref:Cysteine proteinase n=1 Tax=Venturia nashicola TaxID=86259 RepID=A0A4Z1PSD6_9PEZI|nr:cysteine proteinase [Venturia nashicola]TLD38094.1 cysteine proteinase [Venturia nashicola]